MTTNIYVDVDGVLNAVHDRPWILEGSWPQDDWSKFKAFGYSIHFSKTLMEYFKELESRDDVELYWLTTWCNDAATVLSPHFGVGSDWGVVGAHMYVEWSHLSHQRFPWWKEAAIEAHIALTSPDKFVWLDDDLRRYSLAGTDLIEGVPGLSICPGMTRGITKSEIDKIITFLDS